MRRLSSILVASIAVSLFALSPLAFAFGDGAQINPGRSAGAPTCSAGQFVTSAAGCASPASTAYSWSAVQTFSPGAQVGASATGATAQLNDASGNLWLVGDARGAFQNLFFMPGASYPAGPPTGLNNIFYGTNSGTALTSGSNNFGFGGLALASVSTGGSNIAIGAGAQRYGTGSQNICLGDACLGTSAFTGSSNVAVGLSAGRYYTGGASQNIAIGQSSGPSSATSTASNQITIGYGATPAAGDGVSNQTTIGNGSTTDTYLKGLVHAPTLMVGTTLYPSGTYRGTVSWTPGSMTAGQQLSNTVTVTGAAAGADCNVTGPAAMTTVLLSCLVTANTCTMYLYNAATSSQTPSAGTYACRVWNP